MFQDDKYVEGVYRKVLHRLWYDWVKSSFHELIPSSRDLMLDLESRQQSLEDYLAPLSTDPHKIDLALIICDRSNPTWLLPLETRGKKKLYAYDKAFKATVEAMGESYDGTLSSLYGANIFSWNICPTCNVKRGRDYPEAALKLGKEVVRYLDLIGARKILWGEAPVFFYKKYSFNTVYLRSFRGKQEEIREELLKVVKSAKR